jgi:putative oxidoreductase
MTSSTLPGRRSEGHRARFVGSLPIHGPAGLGSHLHNVDEMVLAGLDRATALARQYALTLMRCSLALIFCWFGALKVTGSSPVYALIGATLPWFNPQVVVPVVGVVEVLLGIGLLVPRARRLVLVVLLGHLCGTFLTFLMAPSAMFRGADPLMLTASGEFVLKNLVLISAALLLLGATANSAPGGQTTWIARPRQPE